VSALLGELQQQNGQVFRPLSALDEATLHDRLVEALSHLPTSVMLFDADDRLVFCNEATARYFPTVTRLLVPGTKYEDLLRAHAVSGYVSGIGDDFEAWIDERMKSHRAADSSITRTYADGTASQIVERRTSDGGIICIRTDVTDIRAYEIKLKERSEQLLQSQTTLALAQKVSHTGSVMRDLRTGVVEWSDETYRIFGREPGSQPPSRDEILDCVHPDDRSRFDAHMRASEAGEAADPLVMRILLPDGSVRWVRLAAEVFLDDKGAPVRRLATYRDITKAREDADALEQKTRETEEYAKELERSNRDLEQFAYLASHDLQEPLRMVASYCRLLQRRYRGKLDTDADEFIGYAVEGADRMQRLVNDLLGYSRVGRHGTSFELLPAAKIVEIALQNLNSAIEESGAQIVLGDLPVVAGDPTQLVQLFQNLIGNAIKFRGDNVPAIRIGATPVDENWVEMTIADNGIGIEPAFVDRVFLIFQRLHPRGAYDGTGIGLAVVKKVVENHGGRVWIEPQPGPGTCFHFTLPVTLSKGAS
jgi:signal transduction histidine kinase